MRLTNSVNSVLLLLTAAASSLADAGGEVVAECSQPRPDQAPSSWDLVNLATPYIQNACDALGVANGGKVTSFVTPRYVFYSGPGGVAIDLCLNTFQQILDQCVTGDSFYGGQIDRVGQMFNVSKSCGVYSEVQGEQCTDLGFIDHQIPVPNPPPGPAEYPGTEPIYSSAIPQDPPPAYTAPGQPQPSYQPPPAQYSHPDSEPTAPVEPEPTYSANELSYSAGETEPAAGTNPPVYSTGQPVDSIPRPSATDAEPTTYAVPTAPDAEPTTYAEPSATDAESAATDAEPTATDAEPTTYAEPTATDAEPTAYAEPSATDAESATTDAEPTATDAEPTAYAEPSATDAESATTDAEPAATDAEPAATDAKSTATDSKPTTTDAEPTTTDAEPTTTDAEPTTTDVPSDEDEEGDDDSDSDSGERTFECAKSYPFDSKRIIPQIVKPEYNQVLSSIAESFCGPIGEIDLEAPEYRNYYVYGKDDFEELDNYRIVVTVAWDTDERCKDKKLKRFTEDNPDELCMKSFETLFDECEDYGAADGFVSGSLLQDCLYWSWGAFFDVYNEDLYEEAVYKYRIPKL